MCCLMSKTTQTTGTTRKEGLEDLAILERGRKGSASCGLMRRTLTGSDRFESIN